MYLYIYIYTYIHIHTNVSIYICMCIYDYIRANSRCIYGVASIIRPLTIICLFCKRALQKRLYFAEGTYNFKEPTNWSHPIRNTISVSAHTHAFIHIRAHTHMYICVFTYMMSSVCVCVCVCMCVCRVSPRCSYETLLDSPRRLAHSYTYICICISIYISIYVSIYTISPGRVLGAAMQHLRRIHTYIYIYNKEIYPL